MRCAALAVAVALMSAGCARSAEASGSSQPAVRRYSVVLGETQRTGGLGPIRSRQATVNATVEIRRENVATSLVFTSADGAGDPALVASGRSLNGRRFNLDRLGDRTRLGDAAGPVGGSVGGPVRAYGGILQPAEAVLLFQVLAPFGPTAPPATAAGVAATRSLELDGVDNSPTPLLADDTVTARLKEKGVAAERVTTTALAARQLPPMNAYLRLNSSYAVDASFGDLFAAPPSLEIPTTTQTVTIPGSPSSGSSGGLAQGLSGLFGTVINGLGCVATLGLVCNIYPAGGGSAPSRTETRTVQVPGPTSLATTLDGTIRLTSSQTLATRDATLLTATGTGRLDLSGPLSSGPGVPASVAATTVFVATEVTYSSKLESPWPGQHRGPTVLVKVAGGLAVILVCGGLLTLARRPRSVFW